MAWHDVMIAYKLCHFSWLPCIVNPVIGTSPPRITSPPLHPLSPPLSITSSPPELDQLGQTSAPARHQINMNFISLKPFETPTQSQCNLMANSSYQE